MQFGLDWNFDWKKDKFEFKLKIKRFRIVDSNQKNRNFVINLDDQLDFKL